MDVEKKKEVPTLKEFAPRFIDGDARANRQKPSTITSKESLLRLYLLPRFGERRLDEVTNEDIQHLKAELRDLSTKTVNNSWCSSGAMLGCAAGRSSRWSGRTSTSAGASSTSGKWYMHLSPAAKDAAISLLDAAGTHLPGDILETGSATKRKPDG
ncbi:hypothetical protein [Cystobacter fuscus]|uniref:hypothetical protein n=1 Tax=Cystobacter fuscus TaxID=43 RepID=UPI0037C01368